MVKFKCVTQTASLMKIPSVTGIYYDSVFDVAFDVENKEDIKILDANPRFVRANLLNKLSGASEPAVKKEEKGVKDLGDGEVLRGWLDGIDGLSRVSKEKLVRIYRSKENLLAEYFDSGDLSGQIPERQANKIIEFIGKESEEGDE